MDLRRRCDLYRHPSHTYTIASFTVIVQTGLSVMSLGFLANLNGFVPFAQR